MKKVRKIEEIQEWWSEDLRSAHDSFTCSSFVEYFAIVLFSVVISFLVSKRNKIDSGHSGVGEIKFGDDIK